MSGPIFAVVLAALLSSFAVGQEDETYDFDGVADMDPQPADPTDWMTSENWSDGGFDPEEQFGPLLPDFGTRVEIQTSTFGVNAPEIGPGDVAEAFGVRIGRFGGAGLLTMTGGTLTTADSCFAFPFSCNRRIRVGAANVGDELNRNPGFFNLSGGDVVTDTLWIGSGSRGEMTMTGGTVTTRGDLSLDWSFDAGSLLTMSDGTINVGTNLRMYRNSSIDLDGGVIQIDDAAGLGWTDENVTQTPDVDVHVSGGMIVAGDFLRVDGSVVVDGGIVRADSFNEAISTGGIEVNASGLLQFNTTNESVAAVEALIAGGVITTSESVPLLVDVVDVEGVNFTQVSSPASGTPGDFDGDLDVDGADLVEWQRGFPAVFDDADLGGWQANLGATSAGAAVRGVPEPSSATMAAGVAAAWMASCRRRRLRSMGTADERRRLTSPGAPLLTACLASTALIAGCGDGRPKRLQVSGQVLIDNQPLSYGYIRFVPKDARPSGGRLDENGRFTLSCYAKNDGIIPGVHRVEVDASESLSGTELKWHAPKKYFRYKSSGIEQEVTESTDSLEIHLTWDGGKPFIERVR